MGADTEGFIGHNFGDYKNCGSELTRQGIGFIGHNFGDYKNQFLHVVLDKIVLSVTILETTKTSNGIS